MKDGFAGLRTNSIGSRDVIRDFYLHFRVNEKFASQWYPSNWKLAILVSPDNDEKMTSGRIVELSSYNRPRDKGRSF